MACTQDDAKYLVEQFNSSASMGFLPPLRDAQYYMKLMSEKLGYRFVAVTSFLMMTSQHRNLEHVI